jgi:hypothetical protein
MSLYNLRQIVDLSIAAIGSALSIFGAGIAACSNPSDGPRSIQEQ